MDTIEPPRKDNSALLGMIGGGIGTIFDIINQNKQIKKQKDLNRFNQELQKEMWEYTSYPNQRRLMEEAGLNPGLMYGMGGGGGQSTGSQGQQIPQMQGMYNLQGMEIGKYAAEIDLIKAQTDKLKAETKTTDEQRDILTENLRQSGIETWFRNEMDQYSRMQDLDYYDEEGNLVVNVNNKWNPIFKRNWQTDKESVKIRQLYADLFKTEAEKANLDANALLTNKKAQYYWNELLIAQSQADTAKINALANKLSAEWNTGEFTNWKTWTDLAGKAIESIGKMIPKTTPKK